MIKINVTNIVKFVKEHNLLFYPLIVHILTIALRKSGMKNIKPAYLSVSEGGILSMLWQDFKTDFAEFFQEYVQNCYQHQSSTIFLPQGKVTDDMVLFSYLPEEAVKSEISKDMPIILISPLEEKAECFNLYLQTRNLEITEDFSAVCENLGALL